jgi:hypothetical protein
MSSETFSCTTKPLFFRGFALGVAPGLIVCGGVLFADRQRAVCQSDLSRPYKLHEKLVENTNRTAIAAATRMTDTTINTTKRSFVLLSSSLIL